MIATWEQRQKDRVARIEHEEAKRKAQHQRKIELLASLFNNSAYQQLVLIKDELYNGHRLLMRVDPKQPNWDVIFLAELDAYRKYWAEQDHIERLVRGEEPDHA